jgi:type II secretory pathway pseudopilin PulG
MATGACDNWSAKEVQKTKEVGAIVQAALERFRTETGRYPADLQTLVPTLLPAIPQPTVGRKRWKYEVFKDGVSYAISVQVDSSSEPLLQATSESGWTLDTK